MSYKVDQLFGKESEASRLRRLRRIRWMLAVALPLDFFGVVICTSLPGAVITLWAWQLTEQELLRVEEGMIDLEHAPELTLLRQVAYGALAWCLLGFLVQMYLMSNGFYLRWVRSW